MKHYKAGLCAICVLVISAPLRAEQTTLERNTTCSVAYNILTQFEKRTGKGPRYRKYEAEAIWWAQAGYDYASKAYRWTVEEYVNYRDAVGSKIGGLTRRKAHRMRVNCIELKAMITAEQRNKVRSVEERYPSTANYTGANESSQAKYCPDKFIRVVNECVPSTFLENACRDIPGAKNDPNCRGY